MTTYTDVTPLPSGRYGSRIADPHGATQTDTYGPVVQVVQRIGDEWHGTPARHYCRTLLDDRRPGVLSIDYGQGWHLDETDTAAHLRYAEGALAESLAVSASGTVVDSPTPDPDSGSTPTTPQEAAVTTVSIPAHVQPYRTGGYGEANVGPDERTALTAALANAKVRGITAEQRATFKALAERREVEVVALTDAIVAGLAQAATRLGQSMARRYQRDLLLGAWGWLQAGAPTSHPFSYTTGTSVTVTVVDGVVRLDIDLSEITDKHAAEAVDESYTEQQVAEAFGLIDGATFRTGYGVTVTL